VDFFLSRKQTPTVVLSLQTLTDHKAILTPESEADLKKHEQHTLKELTPAEDIYNKKIQHCWKMYLLWIEKINFSF